MDDSVALFAVIDGAYGLPPFDSLATLDIHFLQFTVESEILSVLYQHTLVISRHHQNLFYYSVKNAESLGISGGGNIDTVVEREFHIFEHRMV